MTAPAQPERAYPLPGPIDLVRFTRLVHLVAEVLVALDYPPPGPGDEAELTRALGRFLHGVTR